MSFVKLLEDVDDMMSMNTHMEGVLDLIGVFDLAFFKLWVSGMMCRMVQDLP